MKCNKCGAQIDNGAKYCGKCGYALESQTEYLESGKRQSKHDVSLLLFVMALVSIVSVCMASVLLHDNGDETIENSESLKTNEAPIELFVEACQNVLYHIYEGGNTMPAGTVFKVSDYRSSSDNTVIKYFGVYPEEMKLYIVFISDKTGVVEGNYHYDNLNNSWEIIDETFTNFDDFDDSFESAVDIAAIKTSKEAQQKMKIDLGEKVYQLTPENIDLLSELIED